MSSMSMNVIRFLARICNVDAFSEATFELKVIEIDACIYNRNSYVLAGTKFPCL